MFLKSDTHFLPFHFVHTHYYSWHRCRVNLPDSRPVNDQVFVICRPGVLVWHRHRSVYYCPTGRAAWRVQQVKWLNTEAWMTKRTHHLRPVKRHQLMSRFHITPGVSPRFSLLSWSLSFSRFVEFFPNDRLVSFFPALTSLFFFPASLLLTYLWFIVPLWFFFVPPHASRYISVLFLISVLFPETDYFNILYNCGLSHFLSEDKPKESPGRYKHLFLLQKKGTFCETWCFLCLLSLYQGYTKT